LGNNVTVLKFHLQVVRFSDSMVPMLNVDLTVDVDIVNGIVVTIADAGV
jgi:UV DNA damage repair endonuclease